ncbi:lamin tail domain-containing protein [Candidatus Daviesbacteria bacterium]|nr:lamin tail domain-containing protein [Candidatus Daviesbacteria bacterium]
MRIWTDGKATIIIYEELKSLKKELLKYLRLLFRKKKQKNLDKEEGSSFIRLASILPFLGASLIFAAVSSSFFLDEELSINNILSAATTFPTASPSPGPQTLVINEVLPDSSCTQGNTEAQWIEVYNGYSVTVNLKNFKISDGVQTIDLVTANNIVVPSGGFALLAHNNAIWNNCYSDNGVITANLGGQLNIDTGFLMLFDSGGNAIDTVAWGAGTGLEPIQDESIEREPDGLDTATGTNFNPSDFQVKSPPAPGI